MAVPRLADPRLLLVEGADDEHVIRHLWEQTHGAVSFGIEQMGGVRQIREVVEAHAKVPGRVALAIVVDSNADSAARWQSIKDALGQTGVALPRTPHRNGTIISPPDAGMPRVGVWLMPDNQGSGEIEDFLAALIPPDDAVWELAQQYIAQVPGGQLSKPAKARLHAWLAVRTQGGRLGTSISAGAFDLRQPAAQAFLGWLQRVFQ